MNKLSLIICTVNRITEPINLINSLEKQSIKDFNVVIVDQNKNDNLKDKIINKYPSLKIKYIHDFKLKGLSTARNKAILENYSDYLAFPDDDCTYSSNFIEKILIEIKKEKPKILSVPIMNSQNERIILKKTIDKNLNLYNFWSYTCSASIIVKRDHLILFDENFGLGSSSIFQSGEDSDFILKYIKSNRIKGSKVFKNIYGVYHPNIIFNPKKTYIYGVGKGGVIKKNNLFFLLIIDMIKYLLKYFFIFFDYKKFVTSHQHFTGILKGFISFK